MEGEVWNGREGQENRLLLYVDVRGNLPTFTYKVGS